VSDTAAPASDAVGGARRLFEGFVGIEPTERCVWALVAVGLLGLLGAALPTVGEAALALGCGLVLGFVTDLWLAGSPHDVVVEREVRGPVLLGAPAALTWRLSAPRRALVRLTDALPGAAAVDGRGAELFEQLHLAAGERVDATRELVLFRRGEHRFGRLSVRTLGPLGLVRRRARRALPTSVRVLPDLGRIAARAERLLRGQDGEGARKRRVVQEGRELESLREYSRGDDPRLIEWKASARAGVLVTKRLMPETRQDLVILLDTGRQLVGRYDEHDGGEPRLDAAVSAALTLAAAALARGDRVGLLSFAGDVRGYVAPLAGRAQLRRLATAVNEHDALPEEAGYGEALRFLLARQERRALVVLLTDVVDEPGARALAAACARLRGRHLPLVLALGDPALARLARGGDDDDDVRLAAARLLHHRRAALAAVRAAGALVIDAPGPKAAALAVRSWAGLKAAGKL
jgi:uncharacterized protein (DUF58 family)